MSCNFYLPQKSSSEVIRSLPNSGTYSWVAPNANNDGFPYKIKLQMWGSGGAGNSSYTDQNGGGGGGGGSYVYSEVTVTVGQTYSFSVGAGGTSNGAGGITRLFNSSTGVEIVRCNGGGAGGAPGPFENNKAVGGSGGNVTITNSGVMSNTVQISGGAGGGTYINGSSVSPTFGQAGGSGGVHGPAIGGYQTGGGGGGAAANSNGANGVRVGGGGGGYSSSSGIAGVSGRISFIFSVSNGGSGGSAPA